MIYFRPYTDFFSLQTNSLFPFSTNPSSYFMYISSSRSPYRNVVFTSICSTSRSKETTIDKRNRIEVNLETGEKNLTKVNSLYLGITFFHKPNFAFLHFSFCIKLILKQPFSTKIFYSSLQLNYISCLILIQGIHFFNHGLLPEFTIL
jgi:hypothetical protein